MTEVATPSLSCSHWQGNSRFTSLARNVFAALGLFFCLSCACSSTSAIGKGELQFMVVDSPAGVDSMHLVVTKVEVHAAGVDSTGGWIQVTRGTAEIDLLNVTDGASSIIGNVTLPIGRYDRIRVSFGSGNSVFVNGLQRRLDMPDEMSPTIDHEFSISEGRRSSLTLGVDAARSVTGGVGHYEFRPKMRIVANDGSGAISGTIGPIGAWATITAVGLDADTVSIRSDSTNGSFTLAALPAGSYNLTIEPGRDNYLRTMVTGVQVSAQKEKHIGTIILTERP